MTEIDRMPAGREMDALVAERVMGWTRVGAYIGVPATDGLNRPLKVSPQEKVGSPDDEWEGSQSVGNFRYRVSREYPTHEGFWQPSRRIQHAWEVVEKMVEGGLEVSIEVYPSREPDRGVWCVITEEGGGQAHRNGLAATAPLAICRAALKVAMERSS